LRSTRARIGAALRAPRREAPDRLLLEQVRGRCDALRARWAVIEAACRPLPATLVHADAKPANLLVRANGSRAEVVPIDWAEAGWGVPAVDLTHADGPAYWRAVGGPRREDDHDHDRLALIGATLRWLVAIDKVGPYLDHPGYAERAMDQMRWFRDHLDRALPGLDGGRATA
jgi:hypothetical protein